MHDITLNDPWFDLVKTGQKQWEGRCFWKAARGYKIGDTLRISHHTRPEEPYCAKITDLRRFATFEEALQTLGLDQVLPRVETVEQGVEIYQRYVSLPTQQEFGVIMIKIVNVE